jgi:hypothetical protein
MKMHRGKPSNRSQGFRTGGYCNRIMTGGFGFSDNKLLGAKPLHWRPAKWGRAL